MFLQTYRLVTCLTLFALGLVSSAANVQAGCPFCTAVKQTLRQEFASMDAVAIGALVPDPQLESETANGSGQFRIEELLKGASFVKPETTVQVPYFGANKSERRFLLTGIDPKELIWSSPLPISKEAEEYITKIQNLPADPVARLRFFMNFLEHKDSLLARDAYDEFALAPYEEIKLLKADLSREQLMTWIQDDALSPDRKRLYLTLLGICGTEADADALVERLKSDDQQKKGGLDAMIACYLTLKGEAGLPLIEEQFLANPKSQYADTYAAIMALRFHGTEGGILDRERIVKSMHFMLERPQLADLVIPDLARWRDWSQMDKMVQLFKEATDENSWVRVPVVNYLRACPLPEAVAALAELEKIDPKAVQRAKTFFPIPQVRPTENESSFNSVPAMSPEARNQNGRFFERESALASVDPKQLDMNSLAQAGAPTYFSGQSSNLSSANRISLACVNLLFCAISAIAMWLILTGRETSRVPVLVRVRK